ncbi:hypothetical protein P168DRAFT_324488 [Aspergillus campestris IBT 28561]|uniref:protein-histidine N-methyltransferase n=1 Tax=Aspergillus campestris (strain IBT 28561) TaxID=1392248 RepID=A0A2I1DAY1_ASPC2|nr:uncharacterized protein P168DRAFT_324488 [Aspergillus campestris IBT 28561]PKY07030.1 hypothetical protein P168DRAFT_324488 [Aspergillus campestris IBT 28561]
MFSFGFSGDDIEADEADLQSGLDQGSASSNVKQGQENVLPELVPAQRHEISEWISTLPSQISYNTLTINTAGDDTKPTPGAALTIARREIFDIRTQLMAEDSADHENEELISGLEQGDLKPNFYEGGFKTWECALDLAKVVIAENALSGDGDQHVIELGAGTAVPSLALFAQLLSRPASSDSNSKKIRLTFADYNDVVLRLVTLPNLLLTWNHIINSPSHRTDAEQGADAPAPAESEPAASSEEEELDITPDLLAAFQQDLATRNITIDFISGAWSPAFVDLITTSQNQHSYKQTLILASETIYAPASLNPFSETLLQLLRREEHQGQRRALIAAKKVYFGVGGGVDEFLAVLGRIGGDGVEVVQRLDVQSGGVGRVVLGVGLV